jgi:hypothetical protein
MGYKPSILIGKNRDSGSICPRCTFINEHEFYLAQKSLGNFTPGQIIEAERCAPPPLSHFLARDLGLLGQAVYCFFGSLWLTLKHRILDKFTANQS